MTATNSASAIRLAAFRWLAEATAAHGDVLPRTLLEAGFDFAGLRITLIGPQGIWKPRLPTAGFEPLCQRLLSESGFESVTARC